MPSDKDKILQNFLRSVYMASRENPTPLTTKFFYTHLCKRKMAVEFCQRYGLEMSFQDSFRHGLLTVMHKPMLLFWPTEATESEQEEKELQHLDLL